MIFFVYFFVFGGVDTLLWLYVFIFQELQNKGRTIKPLYWNHRGSLATDASISMGEAPVSFRISALPPHSCSYRCPLVHLWAMLGDGISGVWSHFIKIDSLQLQNIILPPPTFLRHLNWPRNIYLATFWLKCFFRHCKSISKLNKIEKTNKKWYKCSTLCFTSWL